MKIGEKCGEAPILKNIMMHMTIQKEAQGI